MPKKEKPHCTFDELVEAVRWYVNYVAEGEGTDFLDYIDKKNKVHAERIIACVPGRQKPYYY